MLSGFLGQFFSRADDRIEQTIELLLRAVEQPSETLPKTVSGCLPALVASRLELAPELLKRQLERLFAELPAEYRRGAAYALASIVKGSGVRSLMTLGVLDRMESVINNKKAPSSEKAAVLLMIEGLGSVLEREFEPYLSEVLPFVIESFSDREVHTLAGVVATILVSRLSAHGMKRILPVLTFGLEDSKWKSKVGAIEALGKMAFCNP